MKIRYIGRIRLSKEDSSDWMGNPPFMYVTKGKDRSDINCATLYKNKEKCAKELIDCFKCYKHLPSSKMEIMTVSINVNNIEPL